MTSKRIEAILRKGFDDYRDMVNLTRVLVARGWSDDDIQAVLGGNALRVFRTVLG